MAFPPSALSWPDEAPEVWERASILVRRTDLLGDLVDQALTDIENNAPAARRASVHAQDGRAYWALSIQASGQLVVIYWRAWEDGTQRIAYVGSPPRQS